MHHCINHVNMKCSSLPDHSITFSYYGFHNIHFEIQDTYFSLVMYKLKRIIISTSSSSFAQITNECNNLKILHLEHKYAHKYRPACTHSHNTHTCILVKTEYVSGIFTMTNDVHFQGLPHSLPNDMLLLCIKGSSKSLEELLRCFRME